MYWLEMVGLLSMRNTEVGCFWGSILLTKQKLGRSGVLELESEGFRFKTH